MSTSVERVRRAFAHQAPDRTPLFELFNPHHPIHWQICGRNVATDAGLAWDAMADGIDGNELFEANIRAQYAINRYFGLDMVRLYGAPRHYRRPVKTGPTRWTLEGVPYHLDPKTKLVVLENPAAEASYSHRYSEEAVRRELERWDGSVPVPAAGPDPGIAGVRALAERDGVEWVYMGEIGAGTGVAFYPPFMLMWMLEEPGLFRRWLEMQKVRAFAGTRVLVHSGCTVIALGGDVSCDKGPFISPALYREFILPVIQEHVDLVHQLGALAVYTSDGNHWPIKQEFFFDSRIDGYKEVDQAAGMTWPRLIAEGVSERVCILGNLDARRTLCHGTPEEVRREVRLCLDYGRRTPGGHILHASHSVHEDVRVENYRAAVDAYREYFGLEKLPG
ncbi:MAG: uroporphyrinogen decarboxylase family protein [Candidatus Latescibacterota bacterium]